MPDDAVVVAEGEATEDAAKAAAAAEDAEFEAGYADEPTGKTTPPAEDAEAKAAKEAEEKAAKEAEDRAAAEKAAADAAAPKLIQVPENEWNELKAKAKEIDSLRSEHRKELDKAFGKVGGLERTIAAIQAATPVGMSVEVTEDVVADLKNEFPELGDLALKAFKSFAGKLKGTAPVASKAELDPEAIGNAVSARLIALQEEALEEEYGDWRTIVGRSTDADNAYRKWLAGQPADYQHRINTTQSAAVISRSIAKFKKDTEDAAAQAAEAEKAAAAAAAEKAAADKAAAARKGRLAAAAQPKGSGGSVPQENEDDFEAGFKTGTVGR